MFERRDVRNAWRAAMITMNTPLTTVIAIARARGVELEELLHSIAGAGHDHGGVELEGARVLKEKAQR